MKKLVILFIVLVGLLFIQANSRTTCTNGRCEYATVNTDPGSSGYFTNAVNPGRIVGASGVWFSIRGGSTGVSLITLQFKGPGDTDWTDYACYSSLDNTGSKSFDVSTGDDTTLYLPWFTTEGWGLNVGYKDFDDTDAVLDLGTTPSADSTNVFDRLDDSDIPYTLDDSTLSVEKSNFLYGFMAMKLTKNSVTAGKSFTYSWWRSAPSRIALPGKPAGVYWRAGVKGGHYVSGSCSFGFEW